MQIQDVPLRAVLATVALVIGAASEGSAEPISRSNWVPNVGQLNVEGEQPLGDLWTFKCPKGGTVNVSVDTKDDTDNAQSDIDFNSYEKFVSYADRVKTHVFDRGNMPLALKCTRGVSSVPSAPISPGVRS